jgi:hypothetical protein
MIRSRISRFLLAAVPFLVVGVPAITQTYRPGSIQYLVRDEGGAFLDPAKLDAVIAKKGKEMKPGTTFVKNPDGSITDKVKCLSSRVDLAAKPVTLSELTLKYRGQTMRLVFNVTIQEERRQIDSIPFRAGTFRLEKSKWVEQKPEAAQDK